MGNNRKLKLYHGSKTGINGQILPVSRKQCDFGPSFYMGTVIWQPLTLIYSYENSSLYELEFDLTGLQVLDLDADILWALVVAYNRGKLEKYRFHQIYTDLQTFLTGYDVIVGSIADDRLFVVLDSFFAGDITDQVLISCLSGLELGKQFVALTEKACSQIKILSKRTLSNEEKVELKELSMKNRQAGIDLVEVMKRRYRREGRYFDEIVEDWDGTQIRR